MKKKKKKKRLEKPIPPTGRLIKEGEIIRRRVDPNQSKGWIKKLLKLFMG